MLVDGMALLFRAFFATAVTGQFMVNTKGIPTNAIHGFVKHFFTISSRFFGESTYRRWQVWQN